MREFLVFSAYERELISCKLPSSSTRISEREILIFFVYIFVIELLSNGFPIN